jgi:glycosyltransferase involved in cell wall biosynthesis
MKHVKELYELLNGDYTFEEKYPFYKENDGKIHVLYIAPCINGTGCYRMVFPMLELNKTTTHAALISTLHKWSFSKQFDDYDNPIDKRLIEWADYVVLPTLFSDATYIIAALLKINDDIQFVMDIDCNYHRYPKEHPNASKISKQQLHTLLGNIAQMDILTGAAKGLLAEYEQRITRHYSSSNVVMEYLPNLISDIGLQEVSGIKKNDTDKVRIGIIGNLSSYYDLLSIKDVLLSTLAKFGDQIELIFFGWDGKLPDNQEPLKELIIIAEKSVSFLDYYEQLNNLLLDVALLPLTDIPFNTKGKSPIKYLELSAFAIPVIASNIAPYTEVITDGETGLLASTPEQWLTKIEQLITNKADRYHLGKGAFKQLWQQLSYTSRNINRLQHIFN